MSEKEGNTTALSGEVLMESVGSPEEEFKLNTPVHLSLISPSYSSSPTLLTQVSNTVADTRLVSENDGIEANKYDATETVFWYKGGKYPYSAVGGIRDRFTLKSLH